MPSLGLLFERVCCASVCFSMLVALFSARALILRLCRLSSLPPFLPGERKRGVSRRLSLIVGVLLALAARCCLRLWSLRLHDFLCLKSDMVAAFAEVRLHPQRAQQLGPLRYFQVRRCSCDGHAAI